MPHNVGLLVRVAYLDSEKAVDHLNVQALETCCQPLGFFITLHLGRETPKYDLAVWWMDRCQFRK